jgi:hypothetical protein
MRFITCFTILIFLVACQTALKKTFPILTISFDLLIPLIVFLILLRSKVETWLSIIAAGIGVNMLSGAPMGVYLITYIWLFMLFKNVKSYFHTPDSFLFIILVIIGVLVEQLIFGVFYMIQSPTRILSLHALYMTLLQIVLAGITSPVIFIILRKVFDVSDKLTLQDDQGALKL